MGRGTKHRLTLWLALVLALAGCATVRQALGVPSLGDPSVTIKPAETRWLLIKNPRFGDVPSEPEYIWVEEDKIPFTFTGSSTRTRSSPCRRSSPSTARRRAAARSARARACRRRPRRRRRSRHAPRARRPHRPARRPLPRARGTAPPPCPRCPGAGWSVYVDTTRIVIDLIAATASGRDRREPAARQDPARPPRDRRGARRARRRNRHRTCHRSPGAILGRQS